MIKAGDITMNIKQLLFIGLAGLVLTACEGDKSEKLQASVTPIDNINTFSGFNPDPAAPNLPFPTNIFFSGTTDLTLNIPVADANDFADPAVAMNALDGFSTSAPITSGSFTAALDPSSLATAVRMFEVSLFTSPTQPVAGPVVGITSELTSGVDFVATLSSVDPNSSTIAVVPLKPLKPKTSYYVVISNDLKDAEGNPIAASSSYLITKNFEPIVDAFGVSQTPLLSDAQAQALEPLRVLTSTSEATLAAASVSPSIAINEIILSWSFTTQSIDDVLAQVRTDVRALTAVSGFSPTSVGDTPLGAASIHIGALDVPYYLTASASVNDPTALGSFWKGAGGSNLTQFNTAAVATSTQTIPMMVTIPKTGSSPWPVVIYQHGITRKRADVLAVADSLAQAGFAVVAIDLPLHGITGNETDGSAVFKDTVNGERTFDLDLVNAQGAPGPDGMTDSSGTHFINLTNLLNSRDNVRQAVSDLFALVDAINEGAVTDGVNTLDSTRIHFLGHSLGAIVGTPFLALESDVKAAALINGGASIAKILDGSTSFGPVVAAGLAANGVVKGTADFEAFLVAAQTVIDSGDPVNYSLNDSNYAPSAASGRGIYFSEIVGDSVLGNPSDLTVPIRVPDANDTTGTVAAPLAGAEPQIALLGLTTYNSDQSSASLLAATKFTSGYHGSLIDPATDPFASAAVTTELQTEIATFLISNGAVLDVIDGTLLQAP